MPPFGPNVGKHPVTTGEIIVSYLHYRHVWLPKMPLFSIGASWMQPAVSRQEDARAFEKLPSCEQ